MGLSRAGGWPRTVWRLYETGDTSRQNGLEHEVLMLQS